MNAKASARQLLAEALELDEGDLPPNPRIGTVDQWDSLAHMRILLGLEERIGKQLSAEELVAIESLEDIAGVMERYN